MCFELWHKATLKSLNFVVPRVFWLCSALKALFWRLVLGFDHMTQGCFWQSWHYLVSGVVNAILSTTWVTTKVLCVWNMHGLTVNILDKIRSPPLFIRDRWVYFLWAVILLWWRGLCGATNCRAICHLKFPTSGIGCSLAKQSTVRIQTKHDPTIYVR